MAASEDPEPETTLLALSLGQDLSKVSTDQLVRTARLAYDRRDQLKEFIGRTAVQLSSNGMSWAEISKQLGIPLSTIYTWSRPHM